MKKVLVTGGNGHIGGAVVRLLAERGYFVRATVRSLDTPTRFPLLQKKNIEWVKADLLDSDSLHNALDGVEGLFQIAAPNKMWAKNSERDIVQPIVQGSQNILKAAKSKGISKIVYTSTCAAIGLDAPEDRPLNEEDWNLNPITPYISAKTQAERQAWKFAESNAMSLITVCPPSVIGPGFSRHTPSTEGFEKILRGKLPVLPDLGFCFTDVRDIALAHVLAYENSKAKGRYIAAGKFQTSDDLIHFFKTFDPKMSGPKQVLPSWILKAYTGVDWIKNHLTGQDREVTQDMIREGVGKRQNVSSHKIESELGWKARPFEESVTDTLAWIKQHFLN